MITDSQLDLLDPALAQGSKSLSGVTMLLTLNWTLKKSNDKV